MNLASFRRRIRFVRRLLVVVLLFFFSVIVTMAFVKIDERYYASGVVRADDEYSVYATSAGFAKEQLADEGDFVPPGALLYRLDDWDLQRQQVALQNERRELQAQLAYQDVHTERVRDSALPQWLLFPDIDLKHINTLVEERQGEVNMLERLIAEGAISKLEYDRARLQLSQAESDREKSTKKQEMLTQGYIERAVAEAQAQADVLQARLESLGAQDQWLQREFQRREIRAPLPSTVTLALVDAGEPVREGQELMKLYSSDEVALELWGPERNIHRVQPGQKVKFETDVFSALREGYCYGTVDIVALDSNLDRYDNATPMRPRARYFVWVHVDNTPVPLKLGATVRAEIALRREAVYKVLFNLD